MASVSFFSGAPSDPDSGGRMRDGSFPGFDDLFAFRDPCANRPFRARLSDAERFLAYQLAESRPEADVAAYWAMGAAVPLDVVWTTLSGVALFSESVIERLTRANVTGWRSYPVTLMGKKGEQLSGYHGLSIIGRCGYLDSTMSTEIMRKYPGGVFPVLRGLYFDPDSWDGSDMFMSRNRHRWIFSVRRVKELLGGYSNLRVQALSEIEMEM
jgi:hypothetical protein